MKTVIYVISHKDFKKPDIKGYKSLLVGATNHTKEEKLNFDLTDDIGNNISDKNKNYCELTGLYWIWKNSNAEVVGLCHYRRYFTKSFLSSKSKYFLSANDVDHILGEYSVILPKMRYYKETTYQALNVAPNVADAEEMRRAIKILYPDYLDAYDSYLSSNKCYLYNMFIMPKKMVDAYCEWLFNILFFIEQEYKVDNEDKYRSRLFGFLSERLIYVWIIKNVPSSKIKEERVVKIDEKPIWSLGQDMKNSARNLVFKLR